MITTTKNSDLAKHRRQLHELGIIGNLERDPSIVDRADLRAEHFLTPAARKLWQAAQNLRDRSERIDILSLTDEAAQSDADYTKLTEYILAAQGAAIRDGSVDEMVASIRREAEADRVGEIADWLSNAAINRDMSAREMVAEAQSMLSDAVSRGQNRLVELSTMMGTFKQAAYAEQSARERGEHVGSVSTGIMALDNATGGGFPRGACTVVGARPGDGKTAFAMHCVRNSPVPVLLFAFEEAAKALICRELAHMSGKKAADIAGGRWDSGREMGSVLACCESIKADVRLCDARGMSAKDVARVARAAHAQRPVGLIVIDYINRMRHEKADRHDLSIRTSMDQLDDLSGRLNVAMLVASQLNRSVAKDSGNRRPRMDDMRDSGSLEEIAKLGLLLHRPHRNRPPSEGGDDELEILIGKQNVGESHVTVACHWHGPTMTITHPKPGDDGGPF